MLIKKINENASTLALVLDQYQDFVWLDSASHAGPSFLLFRATQRKDFPTSDLCSFLDHCFSSHAAPNVKGTDEKLLEKFRGGWVGYMTYEAFRYNDLIPFAPRKTKDYPLAAFYHYDTFIINENHQSYFVSLSAEAKDRWEEFCLLRDKALKPLPDFSFSNLTPALSCRDYQKHFSEIKEAIARGDYFELNYTQEFTAQCTGNLLSLYLRLRRIADAPMMAFMKFKDLTILSASPERFFCVDQNREISSYPIKGTHRRSHDLHEDESFKKRLSLSQKDKAELAMVTDMIRNDLGRICKKGSVRVNHFAKLKSFSHCHHLVSEISGLLDATTKGSDIFRALFPGGSITGAPKIQVMQHIDALENRARGVYTGAIGYISHNGTMDFNIPIRTITVQNDTLSFASGGGLVADSVCESEYEECLLKASALIEAMRETQTKQGCCCEISKNP